MAESLQGIKRRLTGVKNINQITKAMELVAATKMRRSQEIALASRPYAFTALDILATLSKTEHVSLPPIFEQRTNNKTLYVLIASDKGLAGSFNSSVIRGFEKYLVKNNLSVETLREDSEFVAVGQKAAGYLEKNFKVVKKFVRVGDFTTIAQVEPIVNFLVDGFLNHSFDRVVVFSMNFKSALSQELVKRELFPIRLETLREIAEEIIPKTGRYAELRNSSKFGILSGNNKKIEHLIEPSPEVILTDLARHLVLMQIYHLVLEANASEHAARRAAMKSASDNAKELASDLLLQYNKSRQAAITREIIEITAGAESLQ